MSIATTTISDLVIIDHQVTELDVKAMGLSGDGITDDTAKLQAIIAIISASGTAYTLKFPTAKYLLGKLDFTGAQSLTLQGQGSTIIPVNQDASTFTGVGCHGLTIKNFHFVQTQKFHYNPTIKITNANNVLITDNVFTGCGFCALVYGGISITMEHNQMFQIGIMPRPNVPNVLDPTSNGFSAGFEIYGGGLRCHNSDVVRYINNYFHNDVSAGGASMDTMGGAGGITAASCNDVEFIGNRTINAPGQGHCATGDWQGTTVVAPILNHTFDYTKRGQNIKFIGGHSEGSNQEGFTAFGCGGVQFANCTAKNNRYASFEAWQSWNVIGTGCTAEEAGSSAYNTVLGFQGSAGGNGAVHLVGCHNASWTGLIVNGARKNAIFISGSVLVSLVNIKILGYGGDDDATNYTSSGITCTPFAGDNPVINSTEIILDDIVFSRIPQTHNSGGDIFCQDDLQNIYVTNVRALGRAVTYANATGSIKGALPNFIAAETAMTYGNVIGIPTVKLRSNKILHISTAPVTIFDVSSANGSGDSFQLMINGSNDVNGDVCFTEIITICHGIISAPFGVAEKNAVDHRTYSVSGNSLQLTMSANTYSIRLAATHLLSGSKDV